VLEVLEGLHNWRLPKKGMQGMQRSKGIWQRDNTLEPIVLPKWMITAVTLIRKKCVGLRVYRDLNTSSNTFCSEDIWIHR
jgi:hypothetical protein